MTKLEILLLVEDDDVEALKVEEIIRTVSANIAIVKQTISAEALTYLRQSTRNPPQLILFDLGSNADGIAFMKELKSIDHLKPVPLVVLVGDPMEIARANEAKVADDYILKPIEVQRFRDTLTKLRFTT